MPQSPLHNYLQMYRRRSGLSQDDIAYLLQIDRGSVSRHELGSRNPTFRATVGYEVIFGVPIQDIHVGAVHQVETIIRHRATALLKRLGSPTDPRLKRKIAHLLELAAVADDFHYIPCTDDLPVGEHSPLIQQTPELPT